MFYKGEIPFVRLIIPFIGGILSGYFFPAEELYYSGFLIILTGPLFLFSFVWYYRKLALFRFKWLAGVLAHIFILSAGYWLLIFTSQKFEKRHYSQVKADAFFAVIKSEPKQTGKVTKFEAHVYAHALENSTHRSSGKIVISIYSESSRPKYSYGDVLLLPGNYDSIDPPYNPGEFNYKSYLADHQIYYQYFLEPHGALVIAQDQGNPFIAFALKLRKRMVDKFNKYLTIKDAAGFASTLILGYRADLSEELVEAYSKTGTMHVLSVSGMHVGIVFIVLSVFLKFMDNSKTARLCRALVIILTIWFYALLTGFSAPACRAACMLSFIVLGKALNKDQNTYNLIAISAFFLLLYNPFYLVDTGFQLSYLAVTGLVYFHPKIYHTFFIKNKLLDYTWSYTALSVAAQLATFPFTIYYFHQFPIYFLLSNLLLVLPVAIIMYAGILFMFLPFPDILYPAGECLSFMITATNNVLYYIETLPFSSWEGIWISTIECFLICVLLLCICFRISLDYKRMNLPIAGLTIVLLTSFALNEVSSFRENKIVFYNLRKKTGMAYISNSQSILVTDISKSDKLMKFSLLPAVKSSGSRIKLLFKQKDVFAGRTYYGDGNFYQFGGCKIVRWNRNFDNVDFTKRLTVDYVLLSENPRVTIEKIASCLNFSVIIIEANNPDYKIARWIAEARKKNLPYYVLKKKPALIVKL